MSANEQSHRIIAIQLLHLLAQKPQIDRLIIDRGYGHSRVTLLLMEAVQLFQKVDLCS